jgi:hypothetical protein
LTIREGQRARGAFLAKEDLVVAGLPMAAEVFQVLDASSRCTPAVEEGSEVKTGTRLAVVEGSATALLAGERVALNFLQRLCGVATLTHRLKVCLAGLRIALLDTPCGWAAGRIIGCGLTTASSSRTIIFAWQEASEARSNVRTACGLFWRRNGRSRWKSEILATSKRPWTPERSPSCSIT